MDSAKTAVYQHYWKQRALVAASAPHFPVISWWPDDGLAESEQRIFTAIRGARTLLDVGAGDNHMQAKFVRAGFTGTYHSQDVSSEHAHTFSDLDEAKPGYYDAILCLDVIEHLTLEDGLALLGRLRDLLSAGGVLVLQTPNARCVRNPLGGDMTHLHCYNAHDLWAYLTVIGLSASGYRVTFRTKHRSPFDWLFELAGRWITTRILGCDFADNLLFVARKA